MKLQAWLEHSAQTIVDSMMSLVPRPTPPREKLLRAKLICHRGINPGFVENTLEAFEAAAQAGVWGIEFDVRWTLDGVPVVHHDRSLKRVHGLKLTIEKTKFEKLRARAPQIPTVKELVERFEGRVHFMMEVKKRKGGFTREHIESLQNIFRKLEPVRDYHLMALGPKTLDTFSWVPREACLTISTTNASRIAAKTLKKNYGGHTGYYLLLTNRMIEQHHARKQRVGTGFICSKSILFREINRGVELLYSNQSIEFQKLLRDLTK